jgi:hypothetical protein
MQEITNEQVVTTLRALADWYEIHPNAPIPYELKYGWMTAYMPRSEAAEIMRSLGNFEKQYEDDYFRAVVKFPHMDLRFSVERTAVCARKVVGVRQVPEQVIPSEYVAERVIPAHVEEIVEWDCAGSVLAATADAEVAATADAILRDEDIPF